MTYGNGRNASFHTGPQLWRAGGYVYGVMVRIDYHAVVCQLDLASGTWSTYDLHQVNPTAPPMSLPVDFTDAHKSMSIAVDGDGYIWVTGNMHATPLVALRSTAPHVISSWVDASPDITPSGDNQGTYPTFRGFSDGELWLQMGQQDVGQSTDGRDSILYRLNLGTSTWEPIVGSGDLMIAAGNETVPPGPVGSEINRRAYLYGGLVDASDTFHAWGAWRLRRYPVLQTNLIYLRTPDRGETWFDVTGEQVTVPLTYPGSVGQIEIPGTSDGHQGGNLAIGPDGSVHGTYAGLFNWLPIHFWWDGAAWQTESLAQWGFLDIPAVTFVRGELWFTGPIDGRLTSVNPATGARALHGEVPPPAPATPSIPFPEGAGYCPEPHHSADGISLWFIPQGDTPALYTLGGGPRARHQET